MLRPTGLNVASSTKLLLVLGMVFAGLMSANILVVSEQHKQAIEQVSSLTQATDSLKTQLEVVDLVVPTAMLVDSLTQTRFDSLKAIIKAKDLVIQSTKAKLNKALNDEKINDITNPYNTIPYDSYRAGELSGDESD